MDPSQQLRLEEQICRAICEDRREDPDALEPGSVAYAGGEFTDGELRGQSAFYSWRRFTPLARRILLAIRGEDLRSDAPRLFSDDANEVGPMESGCFHPLVNQVAMVLEHGGEAIVTEFRKALTAAFVTTDGASVGYGSAISRQALHVRLPSLMRRVTDNALRIYMDGLDKETRAEAHAWRMSEEYRKDLTNWLYRRFAVWLKTERGEELQPLRPLSAQHP